MPLNFSALILPDTIPRQDTIRQLLLYFETISLYSPTEDIPDLLPKALRTLCCQYAPVPFGDGLANFQRLIHDMTVNRAEYYSGGLSSMSAKANAIDEESVWRLVSRLSPQTTPHAQPETLLQARLLLKLAEVRDQEEKEIDRALREINGKSQSMLYGLTDGDETEGIEMPNLTDHDGQKSGSNLDHRLKSWAQLFLADKKMSSHWLLSTTKDVLAILADHSASTIGEAPTRLFSLPLPGPSLMALDPPAYLRERTVWRETAAECLTALHSSLKTAASGTPLNSEPIQKQLIAGSKALPGWEKRGQGTLDFYVLPLSLPRLLAKIAKAPTPQTAEQPYPLAVVSVLNP